MAKTASTRSRWRSGCIVIAVIGIGAIGAAIFGVNLWLDSTDYREMAENAIADAIGLPAQIADLDVVIFPTPAIRANRVRIGSKTFFLMAENITAHGEWAGISDKKIHITDINIDSAAITLPEDFEEVSTWTESLGVESSSGKSEWEVAIDTIGVDAITIRQGESDEWIRLTARVESPLQDGRFQIDGDLPIVSVTSRATASGTFEPKGNLKGTVRIDGIALAELETALEPFGVATASIDISSDGWESWTGTVEAIATDTTLTGRLFFEGGALAVNDAMLAGNGIHVNADATVHPSGNVGILVNEATVATARIDEFIRNASDGAVRLRAEGEGSLSVTALHAGIREGDLVVAEGVIAFDNVHLETGDGDSILTSASLAANVKDNTIAIDSLKADGINLRGTITPTAKWDGAHVALSGNATLSDGLLAPIGLAPTVHGVGGEVTIKDASATIAGGGLPDDLSINGEIKNGAVTIAADDAYRDAFKSIQGTFQTDGRIVQCDVRGSAAEAGPFTAKATIDTTTSQLAGTLSGTAQRLATAAYWNDWARDTLEPVFATYGDVSLDWQAALPNKDRNTLSIAGEIPARGTQHLSGEVVLQKNAQGELRLDRIDVYAGFPSQALASLSEPMKTSGPATVRFQKPSGASTFEVDVNLSGAELDLPPYVHAKPGAIGSAHPHVRVAGVTNAPGWAARELILDLAPNTTATGQFTGDGVVFSNVNIPLANVNGYFPPGSRTEGQITASVATSPLEVDVRFASVSMAPASDAEPISVNGALRVTDSMWNIPTLEVRAANSDIRIAGQQQGGAWNGSVQGQQLDVPAAIALVEQWTSAEDDSDAADAPTEGPDSAPVQLQAGVKFDRVLYRPEGAPSDLTLSDVSAIVSYNDGNVRIENISAVPYKGQLTGGVYYASDPGSIDVDMKMAGIDARAIDEFTFGKRRGITGTVNGAIKLRLPMREDIDPAAGMSGNIAIDASKGTLGQMGIATQFLDLLRTVQIWTLLSGWKRENGLIYDTLSAKIVANEGVMQVESFNLSNIYVRVRGSGTVDFAQNASKVPFEVEVLEGIFKPVQAVPVIGQTAGKVGVISAQMTGPPYDPKMAVTNIQGFRNLGDQIRNAGETIEEEVVNRVVQGIGNLLRGEKKE